MTEDSRLDNIIKQVFASLDDETELLEGDDKLPAFSELCKIDDIETMIGQTVGDWLIEKMIGQGGMSVVYLVARIDDSITQQAALKILPLELASQQVVERFVRERQILVDLDHPQIAKLLDLGVTDSNIPWYVMEYFKGQDIISFISEVNADLTQKTNLFRQVCAAIAYAHEQGVVHRDIKPGNILVDDQFKIKVLDFGIALKDENASLTMTGAILGTPGYMSPEQSKGLNDQIDARSDVFSLGTLFYHILVGSKPFNADSAAEMGAQIINEDPKPMAKSIPIDVQAIVYKCLAKNPNNRYASANSLLQDIKAYLNGDAVKAKPLSWFGYWVKKSKKYPKTTGLVFSLFAVGLMTLGAWYYQSYQNIQRLKQAETYVKEAEEIKNQVRRLHMMPLHNVQPEYENIRQQISSLQHQVETNGTDQSGLTDLALGSAFLSMRDFEPAYRYLQKAQSKGWQSKELNEQLGYVLAVEWSFQLKASKRIKDEVEKGQFLADAKVKYYQPAVKLLGQQNQESHYLEGRLAWIEERYDDAIDHYLQELQNNPWHHEAAKQISEVYMLKFNNTGRSAGYDEAMPYMDKSNEYLDRAIEIGRSDPLNYVSRCTNAGIDIQVKRYLQQYEKMPSAFTSGMSACENSLELEPTAFSPYANMNLLLQNRALMLESQEQNATAVYQQALAVAQRGLIQHPTKSPLLVAQIKPLIKLAENAVNKKLDPSEYHSQAIEVANQVIELDPASIQGWKELGRIYWSMADYNQFETEDFEQAFGFLEMAHAAYINDRQSEVSVTSQLNAALIHVQMAKLYNQTNQHEFATEILEASIKRRIEYLPDSKSYFRYLKQALEDVLTLSQWSRQNIDIEPTLTALVLKSCAIKDVPESDLAAFNIQLEELNQILHPENWSLCTVNLK